MAANRWRPDRRKKPSVPELPEVLPDLPFVAVRGFVGARAGFVFKLDSLGLGYYRDDGKALPPANNGYVRSKPITISLEELVLPPAAGVVPWINSSWLKYTLETAAEGIWITCKPGPSR